MAAPHIPNLLSLRGRGGHGRGRGRGGHAALVESPETMSSDQKDAVIRSTDDDASLSKFSAVVQGYLKDDFIRTFAGHHLTIRIEKRSPIINRGTYVRTVAMDSIVEAFLNGSKQQKQIISLGAGSDTRFFRFKSSHRLNAENCLYHELDFEKNTERKVMGIVNSPIKTWVDEPGMYILPPGELHSGGYHLSSVDLRHLDPKHDMHSSVRNKVFAVNPDLPTLIISECCLVYLEPDEADAVVKFITTEILKPTTPCGIVLYEQTNPFDAFGKMMISNLAGRGIRLGTLEKYGTKDTQLERLRSYGFDSGQDWEDLASIAKHRVDSSERERWQRLEFLDEVEELDLLMQHYCIVRGWRNGVQSDGQDVWKHWKDNPWSGMSYPAGES